MAAQLIDAPLADLIEKISPYCHADFTVVNGRWVDFHLDVLMPLDGVPLPTTDTEARTALLAACEIILRYVKARGWYHLRVPRIELWGDLYRDSEPRMVHKCEMRLELECPT